MSPGYTPEALTVGAFNTRGTVARSDDGVATYSSRGPVGDPDDPSTWELKPDLVAPGNAIVAAGAEGSYLWENYPSAAGVSARRRDVSDVVGVEHGDGGDVGRGGAAASGAAEADAGAGEVRAAVHGGAARRASG